MGLKIAGNQLQVDATKIGWMIEVFLDDSLVPLFILPIISTNPVLVDLPGWFFDGRVHKAEVRMSSGRRIVAFRLTHQSQYLAELNDIGTDVFGWIYDKTRPDTPVSLVAELDGNPVTSALASYENMFAPQGKHCGFGFPLPINAGDREAHTFSLRVAGTDYVPFGDYLVNITPEAIYEAQNDTGRRSERMRLVRDFIYGSALQQARALSVGQVAPRFPKAWRMTKHHPQMHESTVNVIIPVYRGLTETMNCVNSVLEAKLDTRIHLTVINDFSPQPELTAALRTHAARHKYEYIENPSNLGFVKTVNIGMALHPDMDVVLLNADTVVSDGWVDRLRGAAYRGERVGSVSAMSNNATICSLPFIGGKEEIPYGMDLAEINRFIARENDGVSVELPTAHGFCMYIRRLCLDEVGSFDADKFGKGYGEENEFSLRSATYGWKHVAACDVFVYHCGSVSFKESAEGFIANNLKIIASEYPDYHYNVHRFLREDPLLEYRNKLQRSLWREKKIALFFSLAIGGGVDSNLNAVAERLKGEGYTVLVVRRSRLTNYEYTIAEWNSENATLYNKRLGILALISDILLLNPIFFHIHHLIDLDEALVDFIEAAGIPYYVTLHDYFYICPRVTLLNDGKEFCAVPPVNACISCLARGGVHEAVHETYLPLTKDVAIWRNHWTRLLKGARKVIAPSEAVVKYYKATLPGLNLTVLQHLGPSKPRVASVEAAPPSRIKVAILGAIGMHKGASELVSLLRWTEAHHPDLEFKLIGYSDRPDTLAAFSNFYDMGPYTHDQLEDKIAKSSCTVALFLSHWPETYSYTLSEAYIHGLTPVAYDIGAFGERIAAIGAGEVVPVGSQPEILVSAIRRAARTRVKPLTYSEGEYASIARDYYDLPEFHTQNLSVPFRLRDCAGVDQDGWCRAKANIYFASPIAVDGAVISLYLPENMDSIFVSVDINDRPAGVYTIKPGMKTDITACAHAVEGLVQVSLSFSHTVQAAPPDQRRLSAVLVDCQLVRMHLARLESVTSVIEETTPT